MSNLPLFYQEKKNIYSHSLSCGETVTSSNLFFFFPLKGDNLCPEIFYLAEHHIRVVMISKRLADLGLKDFCKQGKSIHHSKIFKCLQQKLIGGQGEKNMESKKRRKEKKLPREKIKIL